jgi:hypothetical protein
MHCDAMKRYEAEEILKRHGVSRALVVEYVNEGRATFYLPMPISSAAIAELDAGRMPGLQRFDINVLPWWKLLGGGKGRIIWRISR